MPITKRGLLEWRKHQHWIRRRKRIEDRGPGFVFSKLDGRRVGCFNSSWRKACKIAGFPSLYFHDFRHTSCLNLILSGGDLKNAKAMIGHRDLKMTDRYAHLTSMRKLVRQEDLVRFCSSSEGMKESSEPHISHTESPRTDPTTDSATGLKSETFWYQTGEKSAQGGSSEILFFTPQLVTWLPSLVSY
jgi:hypothetical protein